MLIVGPSSTWAYSSEVVSWLLRTLLRQIIWLSDPVSGSGISGSLRWLVALAPGRPSSSSSLSLNLEFFLDPKPFFLLLSDIFLKLTNVGTEIQSQSNKREIMMKSCKKFADQARSSYPSFDLKQTHNSSMAIVLVRVPANISSPNPKLELSLSTSIF